MLLPKEGGTDFGRLQVDVSFQTLKNYPTAEKLAAFELQIEYRYFAGNVLP